jgi:hypothetical protein
VQQREEMRELLGAQTREGRAGHADDGHAAPPVAQEG